MPGASPLVLNRWYAPSPKTTRASLQPIREKSMSEIISDRLTITYGGQQYELPVLQGTEGERAIDITQLRDADRPDHLRPGLRQHGRLPERHHLHRRREGHPALPRHPHRAVHRASPNFVEVAWLLIFGRLPHGRTSCAAFSDAADRATNCCTRAMKHQFEGFPRRRPADGHPLGHDQHAGLLPPGVPRPGGRRARSRRRPPG